MNRFHAESDGPLPVYGPHPGECRVHIANTTAPKGALARIPAQTGEPASGAGEKTIVGTSLLDAGIERTVRSFAVMLPRESERSEREKIWK